MSALGYCDWCHGPANWCLDKAGEVWERCMDDSCSSRVQLDMFPEEPIWEDGVHVVRERDAPTDPNQTRRLAERRVLSLFSKELTDVGSPKRISGR